MCVVAALSCLFALQTSRFDADSGRCCVVSVWVSPTQKVSDVMPNLNVIMRYANRMFNSVLKQGVSACFWFVVAGEFRT